MSFDTAIKVVLAPEGGYSDDRCDKGGKTRYCIIEAVARQSGYTGAMCDLPLQVATDVYRKRYWSAAYDQLPDAVGTKVFDTAVNSGPHSAHVLLQQAANALGAALVCDGALW